MLLVNTLTGKKEEFVPITKDKVGLYSCGPTVYDFAHIGNLRAYIFVDILKRTLLANGYKVNHVMNITDVGHLSGEVESGEDKMEKGARREGKTVWEIIDFYTDAFFKDTKKLNILPADIVCKATDHIKDMINLIEILEKNGFTYIAGGNVYFRTSKFPKYGKMAKLNLTESARQSRVEDDPYKKSPFDFVLWFTRHKYKSHEMQWDSPWGRGFPGWHIECSAMAMKYLGKTIDIHTGGIDHIPVHHTNEIAQSEAATGKQFARYWLHVAFLTVDAEKMAKSEKNFFTLQDIINKKYDPLAFRYLLLTAKYSAGLNFTWNSLDGAQKALSTLRERIADWENVDTKPDNNIFDEFKSHINDDLNTPKAIALLWKIVGSPISSAVKKATVAEFDKVLGLDLLKARKDDIPEEIKRLNNKRENLRKEGKWEEADKIRTELESKGYKVRDTKEGSFIKR